MTLRRWLLGSVAVCVLASGLWAKHGIVTHRDGNTYTGDVSEEEQGKVVVTIRGVKMPIDRRDVVSIKYIEPGEDFQAKLAALQPSDVKGRMDLASWALSQRKYDWAIQAAESVLKADPNSAEATNFITMVRRQRALDQMPKSKPPADGQPVVTRSGGPATTGPAAPSGPVKLLSADDINLIRQGELRPGEDAFRVQFNNDVRRKFIDKHGETIRMSLAQFSALPVQQQAREILRNAPDMKNDVRITSDPASMAAYKTRVQPTILQGCATAGCHSGGSGGGFVLHTGTDDTTSYTNFYILNAYMKQVGQQKYNMIERTTPQRSLLLQYGLPAENAEVKHPAVQNYQPIYKTPTDPRFQTVARWLGESLEVQSPDYKDIKYDIPKNPSKAE